MYNLQPVFNPDSVVFDHKCVFNVNVCLDSAGGMCI